MIPYFEKEELIELIFSILILSFVFSTNNLTINISKMIYYFLLLLPILFLKEILQKKFAKILGYSSKVKLYLVSSILAIFVSFIGIKLAAPTYSELSPYKFSDWKFKRKKFSVEDEGKIILVGILTLLSFCIIFKIAEIKELKNIFALILVFNLLPILPFDGVKILKWSFSLWSFLFIFSLLLLIL